MYLQRIGLLVQCKEMLESSFKVVPTETVCSDFLKYSFTRQSS